VTPAGIASTAILVNTQGFNQEVLKSNLGAKRPKKRQNNTSQVIIRPANSRQLTANRYEPADQDEEFTSVPARSAATCDAGKK